MSAERIYQAVAVEADIDPRDTIDNPQFRAVVDAAYRAGREDAASALARARANFTASPEAAFPLKLDGRQYLSRGMAVEIARGEQAEDVTA